MLRATIAAGLCLVIASTGVNAQTLRCIAEGSPDEFPSTLRITNYGPWALRTGTRVNWIVHGNSPQHGVAVLPMLLKVNAATWVQTGTSREPFAPCEAVAVIAIPHRAPF
jgi:hypothetical protein